VKYPAISSEIKTGEEAIIGVENLKILDFWQWAYSDVIDNAQRGIFAEWIVSKALNSQSKVRSEWDKYDILTPEGIKVEVKTSGYLQSWGQNSLSKISFGIQPTRGWDHKSNTYEKEIKRQADVYVFCVHKHLKQETLNPLDISQWDFYVLDTETINCEMGNKKSITLPKLIDIGAVLIEYNELNMVVKKFFIANKNEVLKNAE